jgi:TorA maturation chaperone TorD
MLARKERRLEKTLAHAAIFRLLARAFAHPAPGHVLAVNEAFAELDKTRVADREPLRRARALARTRNVWRRADETECAREYMRLFLGSGPVSLHETAYGDGRRLAGRAVELADIGGFYAAFGFALSESEPDLPDHLCAELEFYSLLLVKEAYALSRGWFPQVHIVRTAAGAFLEQHLGRWVGAFKSALGENNAIFYGDLAQTVEIAVEAECKRRRVQPVSCAGRLPDDATQDEPLVCPYDSAVTAH